MGKFDPRTVKRLSKRRSSRIEVGEPFRVEEGNLYMCLAKIVGPKFGDLPTLSSMPPPDNEDETLCVISEEGTTPEEAKANLMTRLATIDRIPTVPPSAPRPGWLSRLIMVFARGGER